MPHINRPFTLCPAIALLLLSCISCTSTPHATSTSTLARPASPTSTLAAAPPATLIAHHTKTPMKIDGKLDEPIWQTATAYPLHLAVKPNLPQFPLQETAVIRLAWDDQYLYVAGDFQDADIVDQSKEDQQFLYSTGDTMELFLKPSTRRWYWEFYGTPRSRKTTLFYPSRGRFGLNPWPYQPNFGLKVAGSWQGSLNNLNDRDQGFIIEMAIPRKELNRQGQGLAPDNAVEWSILVARYNYSAFSETFQSELSTTSKLPISNFHIYENWAKLKLVP